MLKIIKNPNKEIFDEVTKAVQENDGYCPCELQKNEDTKCMCKNFKEQKHRRRWSLWNVC